MASERKSGGVEHAEPAVEVEEVGDLPPRVYVKREEDDDLLQASEDPADLLDYGEVAVVGTYVLHSVERLTLAVQKVDAAEGEKGKEE